MCLLAAAISAAASRNLAVGTSHTHPTHPHWHKIIRCVHFVLSTHVQPMVPQGQVFRGIFPGHDGMVQDKILGMPGGNRSRRQWHSTLQPIINS